MNQNHLEDGHPTDAGSRRNGIALALFASIAALMAVDVFSDSQTGAEPLHLSVELLVMVLAAAGVVFLWRGLQSAERKAAKLDQQLEAARLEAARFRNEAAEALRGLGEAIDAQFERWGLTPAEREVGLLMLKGLSHREVAEARSIGEATVRQQAQALYRKSGLRNRSDLSAFFLEDLLLPRDQS
ncbi:MAG: LuxR C-terminal-related transcriptional regulator [Vicinamibacterales bacterium]